MLKIGQISDIHIGEDENLVQGIDVRANFMKAMNSPSMRDIDLLVLSGDLANENAEEGSYQYIAGVLKRFSKPYFIIPGNHDQVEVMAKFFDFQGKIHDGKCFYRADFSGRSIYFLDSSVGEISENQLNWLKEDATKKCEEVILFVHHPPCLCNHRFMDLRYHLKNIDEVQKTLASIPNLKHIFCGHYHFDSEIKLGHQKVYVTPSTQMQIDPNTPHFNLKSSAPGWRVIEWGDNYLETSVYFD